MTFNPLWLYCSTCLWVGYWLTIVLGILVIIYLIKENGRLK